MGQRLFFWRNPMMDEGMQIKGSLTLVLAKPSGEVEVVHKDNIIVMAALTS